METTTETKPSTANRVKARLTTLGTIDRIECRLGTYLGKLLIANGNPDGKGIARVVTAWKGPVFRGSTFTAIYSAGHRVDLSLNDVCRLFDVSSCSRADANTAVKAPVAPTATVAPVKAPKAPRKAAPKAPKTPVEAPAPVQAVALPTHTPTAPKAPPVGMPPGAIPISDMMPTAPTAREVAATLQAKGIKVATATGPGSKPLRKSPKPTIYTVGYDGGLSPGGLADIMRGREITKIIDTRIGNTRRAPGWSSTEIESSFGTPRYIRAEGFGAVQAAIAAAGHTSVILLRKEAAPGDSAYALEMARKISVVHLYENEKGQIEEVTGRELQRAIDADDDYDCDVASEPTTQKSEAARAIA